MANGGHICQWIGTKFERAQLDHKGTSQTDKFQKNLTSGLRGDYGHNDVWMPDSPPVGLALPRVELIMHT